MVCVWCDEEDDVCGDMIGEMMYVWCNVRDDVCGDVIER